MRSTQNRLSAAAFDIASLLLIATFSAHAAERTGMQPIAQVRTAAAATESGLAPQVDRAGGVTAKVTPRTLARNAPTWEFAVVLDTHTQELSQDLARSAVLVDAHGARHAPLAWEGSAPGGHHREGVLRFKPLAQTDTVVLELSGIGGVPVRTFRWQIR